MALLKCNNVFIKTFSRFSKDDHKFRLLSEIDLKDLIHFKKYAIRLHVIAIILFSSACKNTSNIDNLPKIYYVSNSIGNDKNDGLSPNSAWATIDKINNSIFHPGDKILFKSGDIWNGQLELKHSGKKDSIIVVNKYGKGSKPKIEGLGEKKFTFLLKNISYCTVKNLEITNFGNEPLAGRTGILIQAVNSGDCHNIILDSLEVHHVNGSLVKKDGGGSAIRWENKGDSIKSRFVDLKIQNNYLHHTGRNGITSSGYASRDNWYPSIGVVIKKNLLEHIPGDGIVPIGTDGALIEHNIMRDCPDILSHEEAAAGIWPWSSDNTVIQFNKVIGHKAKWDGQGFDSDYNCNNTLIQYNYSSENYGGFLLICNDGVSLGKNYNRGTKNTIIRNNISFNDGIRPYPTKRKSWFSPLMHITGPVENTKIYDNLFVKTNNTLGDTLIVMDNWGGIYPINTTISDNIFFAGKTMYFEFKDDVNTSFYDNYLSHKISPNSYQNYSGNNKILENQIVDVLLKNELDTAQLSKELINKWIIKTKNINR